VSEVTQEAEPLVVRNIQLRGVNVADFQHTSQYHDELIRELHLIQAGDSAEGRLAEVTRTLLAEFTSFSPGIRAAIDDAAERGETVIDIDVRVPVHLRAWLEHFRDHFREIDLYCQAGFLLSLGSPAVAVACREWFLGQFIEQLDGQSPTPYPSHQ
jgi:hypothetical protein